MIRYSPKARADLRQIVKHITDDNGHVVAQSVTDRIDAGIRHLERFPQLGRSGRVQGTRELGIAGLPFLAVYRIESDAVLVLRVLHGAQRWPP